MSAYNGHDHDPLPNQPPAQPSAEEQVLTIIRPIIGNTINGLLLTLRGVHPEVIQKLSARVTGEIIGAVIANNVSHIAGALELRSAMKDEFAKGIAFAKMRPQAMPTEPAPGAAK